MRKADLKFCIEVRCPECGSMYDPISAKVVYTGGDVITCSNCNEDYVLPDVGIYSEIEEKK